MFNQVHRSSRFKENIEIDFDALHYNFTQLKKCSPSTRILAIVKADAYGHGLIEIAQALRTADGFGVSYLWEAIQLRKAGITQRIVLLQGCVNREEYYQVAKYNLDVVVHDAVQVAWLNQVSITSSIVVWLKVNTGMNRLGFPINQTVSIWLRLLKHPKVQDLILMGHLACADQFGHDMNDQQQERFENLVSQLGFGITRSLANSAALMHREDMHYEWVRPGLALYGVLPYFFLKSQKNNIDLKPVMTVKANIIAIQNVSAGESIGYHNRSIAVSSKRIGVIAFGYANGYPYNAPDGTPVLFKNQRLSLIGQVSMNMMTVDLHNCPDATIGDTITLWGKGLNVEEIARVTGRSSYELLCGVRTNIHHAFEDTIL